MTLSLILAALGLASAASVYASPVPSTGGSKQPSHTCYDFTVEIPLTNVSTVVLPVPEIQSAYQATYYANLISTRNVPGSPPPQSNLTTLTKTFNITGRYCTPREPGPRANTVHLLTHGIGFNSSYWDLYLPSNVSDTQYSYVYSALAAGYSTLAWNRLGCNGLATLADPYTEIQSPVELALLAALTNLTLAGDVRLTGLSTPNPPSQIIHVGHSWGSILSKALAIHHPNLASALVLTGYSDDLSYQPFFPAATSFHIANQNQPARFPDNPQGQDQGFSNGFLTWGDQVANQYTFLRYPNFDPSVLEYAEATKQPFTLGEFLSVQTLVGNATAFDGKVYYLASENDVLFCGGQCAGIVTQEGVTTTTTTPSELVMNAFPMARNISADIVPGAGHGLNLHYGADKAYAMVMEWVAANFE